MFEGVGIVLMDAEERRETEHVSGILVASHCNLFVFAFLFYLLHFSQDDGDHNLEDLELFTGLQRSCSRLCLTGLLGIPDIHN